MLFEEKMKDTYGDDWKERSYDHTHMRALFEAGKMQANSKEWRKGFRAAKEGQRIDGKVKKDWYQGLAELIRSTSPTHVALLALAEKLEQE